MNLHSMSHEELVTYARLLEQDIITVTQQNTDLADLHIKLHWLIRRQAKEIRRLEQLAYVVGLN